MGVRLKPPMHAGLFTSDFDASKALPDTVISIHYVVYIL